MGLRNYGNLKIAVTIAYMGLIFYLSSIPLGFQELINKLDPTKFSIHVAEYSVLGFLLFEVTGKFKPSLLIGSLYGVSDELHQFFVPFRTASYFDVIADSIGVLCGILITKRLRYYNSQKGKPKLGSKGLF